MATLKQDVMKVARNYLRDFGQFFQASFDPAGRTYELGAPNIDPVSVWVAYVPNSASAGSPSASVGVIPLTATSDYDLDGRNSLLRLRAPLINAYKILVEGYHYEWIGTTDLDFYADMAIHMDTHGMIADAGNLAPAVVDLVGVHTLVEALWGLMSEFARDIDVITSESVHIQASQRFRMVSSLLDHWEQEYRDRASTLNIGLNAIEVFNMRRVSRTTERFVPLYRSREFGDIGPIERLWPDVGNGVLQTEEPSDRLRQNVYVEGDPPPAFGYSTGYGPW